MLIVRKIILCPKKGALDLWVACYLRARAKITSHFRLPSLGHLQPLLNRKILDIAVLCLRSCSIVAAESDPNLGAKNRLQNEIIGSFPGKLFLREPLGKDCESAQRIVTNYVKSGK